MEMRIYWVCQEETVGSPYWLEVVLRKAEEDRDRKLGWVRPCEALNAC